MKETIFGCLRFGRLKRNREYARNSENDQKLLRYYHV